MSRVVEMNFTLPMSDTVLEVLQMEIVEFQKKGSSCFLRGSNIVEMEYEVRCYGEHRKVIKSWVKCKFWQHCEQVKLQEKDQY